MFLSAECLQEFWHRWRWQHFQGRVWSHQKQFPLPQQIWRTRQEPVRSHKWTHRTKWIVWCVFASVFFICSSNRDGKISREEMIDYFMKASSLLNCKMGFIHTFTETTYVKPTFCEHCAGFVRKHFILLYIFFSIVEIVDFIDLIELLICKLRFWSGSMSNKIDTIYLL